MRVGVELSGARAWVPEKTRRVLVRSFRNIAETEELAADRTEGEEREQHLRDAKTARQQALAWGG